MYKKKGKNVNSSNNISKLVTRILSDLNSFLNHIPEPMFVFGESGKVYTVNNAFLEFSGYSRIDVENLGASDFFSDFSKVESKISELQVVTDQVFLSVEFLLKNGKKSFVSIKFTKEKRDLSEILSEHTMLSEDLYIGLVSLSSNKISNFNKDVLVNDENLFNIINSIPDLVLKVDREYKIVSYNIPSSFDFSVYNCSRNDIEFSKIFPKDSESKAKAFIEKTFMSERIQEFDYEITLAQSEVVKYFEVRLIPSSKFDVMCMIRDVSGKHIAEKNLQEIELKYKNIFENSPVGFFRLNLSGNFIEMNNAMAKTLGYSSSSRALSKVKSLDQVLDTTKSEIDRLLKQADRKLPKESVLDVPIIKRDGGKVYSRITLIGVFDKEFNLVAYDGILKDITTLKEKELNLSYEKMFLEKLIEQMPIGVAVKNAKDSKFISWNQFLEGISKIKSADIIGKSEFEFYDEITLDEIIHSDLMAIDKGEPVFQKEVESSPFGKGKILNITRIPIFDNKSKEISIILILVEDITDASKLQKELVQSEKMRGIGQLAGGIAHDFNNQLMGILGYADILKEQLKGTEFEKHIEMISTAAERSAELTNQLLAFSRKAKFVNVKVDLHQILREVVSLLKYSVDKRISIKLDLNADFPIVFGDPNQLQNIFLNLALNSCDAINDRGQIVFETDIVYVDRDNADFMVGSENIRSGGYMKVSVIDNGSGIEPSNLKKIFEPFFSTKSGDIRGTGMGLAAVFGTVQSHSGAISVTSVIGKGSRFDIYLPWEKYIYNYKLDFGVDSLRTGGRSVLVVDDEDIVRSLICDILVSGGFSVESEKDPELAVDFYAANHSRIDVVILDMVMPKLDGSQVFEKMKKINPEANIILLSGYSYNKKIETLLEQGALGFIQKPINKKDLVEKIIKILKLQETFFSDRGSSDSSIGGDMGKDKIDILDVDSAVERIGGSREIYDMFAGKFLEKYQGFVDEASLLLEENDSERSLIAFHNIKGIAGNLGASRLHKISGDIENMVRTDEEITEEVFAAFAKSFADVVDLLKVALKKELVPSFSDFVEDSMLESCSKFLYTFKDDLISLKIKKVDLSLQKMNEFTWPSDVKSDLVALDKCLKSHNYKDSLTIVDKIIEKVEFELVSFKDESTLKLDLDA
ncbi:MAG: PAS domain S-box protein [Spirochaetales bacterium]|nr:PAS domain S-box protein [Spirochaetales bacterium]